MNGDQSPTSQSDGQSGWVFKPNNENKTETGDSASPKVTLASISQMPEQPGEHLPSDDTTKVNWSASSYIAHEKGKTWYGLLVIFGVALLAGIYFLTRDLFSTIIVAVTLVLFGYGTSRKPLTMSYELTAKGIKANDYFYNFKDFKSFGLQKHGAFSSLVFMPLKRFMLPLYVYFPPDDQEKIVNALSRYLPFSPVEPGIFDRASHRMRF